MPIIQVEVELTMDKLLEAARQLSPTELEQFVAQVLALQAQRKALDNAVLEPDVDEPQTMESLAAKQRQFLAANQQESVDAELSERFQKDDIEWALRQKSAKSGDDSWQPLKEGVNQFSNDFMVEREQPDTPHQKPMLD